ncbi:MAG: hypothetical protein JSV49_04925 [Thermoplasmata archaeon]|nr:MAG: hypothetical protein JSV49_04925 [Thermoplasmata archaeon]
MSRTKKYISVSVLGMFMVMSILAGYPVQGHYQDPQTNEIISLSGKGTATIDGIIDSTEWADADSMNTGALLDFVDGTVLKNYPVGTSPYSGTIYVMNDGCNLYIGFKVNDATLTEYDVLTVSFDDDHDGWLEAYTPLGYPTNGGGEDMVGLKGNGYAEDRYIVSPYGTYVTSAYDPVGYREINGACTNDGTYSYFEISHPLDTSDDDHDFDLSAGDTIGFTLGYHASEVNEAHCWPSWVYGTTIGMTGPLSGYQNAGGFANIVIKPAGPCGAVPASVSIGPKTLNLKSNGNWVTSTIKLPGEYDVNDIDLTTVVLQGANFEISAVSGQFGGNGITVKFDRSELISYLSPGDVELTVTGEFLSGGSFAGSDTIKVINPGN